MSKTLLVAKSNEWKLIEECVESESRSETENEVKHKNRENKEVMM